MRFLFLQFRTHRARPSSGLLGWHGLIGQSGHRGQAGRRRSFQRPGRRRLGYLEVLESRRLLTATPFGAASQDTGEFMLGSVLVTPVLLESTGEIDPSTEDWTPELIEQAKQVIQEGVQWWEATLANYNTVHSLDFQFDFSFADSPVPTKYEPISRVSNDYQLWVNEFLDYVGFQSPESLHHDIREFNHAQREAHGTDWAFTIFVVNSQNDSNGQFAPGGSFSRAFAFAGGQFFVSPSTRPASTFAHETGHMFWARDEYLGGGSFQQHRGYYDTQNWNAMNNPTPGFVHQPSIMASGASLEFAYQTNTSAGSTLEMIGWRDSNGNGIFDVLDVPHHLEGIGYFDHATGLYRFEGTAEVGTLPNQNSSGLQNDITINRITRAEYRLDGGEWKSAGEYGTFQAELNLTLDVPEASVLVEIRTITLDPITGQLIAASPLFSGWSHETTATARPGLQGFAWNDVNADGEWDPGEIGLVGQTIQLMGPDGALLPGPENLDPGDFGNNLVLNEVHDQVTLRATGINVSGNSVISRDHQHASTGSRLFGFLDPLSNARTSWFREGSELLIEFANPQSHVQLDAIGAGGPSSGRLEAYDANGNLLGRYNSQLLGLGEVETMSIVSSSANIASVRAHGRSLEPVLLDNLRWGPITEVIAGKFGSYQFTGLVEETYLVEPLLATGATVTTPESGTYEVLLESDSSESQLNFGIHPQWPWQNPIQRYDVNGDGVVNPFDALVLVSELQSGVPATLPFPSPERSPPNYFDVAGNGQITPFDALLVVSHLREMSTQAPSQQRSFAGSESGNPNGLETSKSPESEDGSGSAFPINSARPDHTPRPDRDWDGNDTRPPRVDARLQPTRNIDSRSHLLPRSTSQGMNPLAQRVFRTPTGDGDDMADSAVDSAREWIFGEAEILEEFCGWRG